MDLILESFRVDSTIMWKCCQSNIVILAPDLNLERKKKRNLISSVTQLLKTENNFKIYNGSSGKCSSESSGNKTCPNHCVTVKAQFNKLDR